MARDKKYKERKDELIKRHGCKCSYCGVKQKKDKLRVDHVYPKSKGGKNNINNYLLSCERCNLSKHNKTLNEWLLKNILYFEKARQEVKYRRAIVKNLIRITKDR